MRNRQIPAFAALTLLGLAAASPAFAFTRDVGSVAAADRKSQLADPYDATPFGAAGGGGAEPVYGWTASWAEAARNGFGFPPIKFGKDYRPQ